MVGPAAKYAKGPSASRSAVSKGGTHYRKVKPVSKKLIICLVLGMTSGALFAQADPNQPRPEAQAPTPPTPPENVGKPIGEPEAGFDQLDANHDRKISTVEAKASTELTTRFAELDGDHNGSLSLAEYRVFATEAR
jgi:hypothetical protein